MTYRPTPYGSNIVQFPRKGRFANCLSKQDRQEVASFRPLAEAAGYDALMVHVMSAGECMGTSEYVSAYRLGEAWSTWGFVRDGATIRVWNALSLEDVDNFPSLQEALHYTLLGTLTPKEMNGTAAFQR